MELKPVIIIVLAFVLLIPLSVFAQESLIFVQTGDNNYDEGDTIVISGQVSTPIPGVDVVIQLFREGNMVAIKQATIAQDGSYSYTILAEGPLWKKAGTYVVRASYEAGGTMISETEFTYSPKSDSITITTNYEVDAGSSGTFDVGYTVKGGTIIGMIIDSSDFALVVQIDSTDEGTVTLELPREYIGAEKQDGKDDTFIILIDGIEVAYNESIINSDSRVITINFEQGDSDIEIIGTYVVSAKKPTGGTGDGQFRSIPETPNVGSTVRITGYSFESLQEFDFYIDSTKIGSFVTDNTGYFVTTMTIPENQKADRVDFKIINKNGEEKKISLRLDVMDNRISESPHIPLTAQINTYAKPTILISTDNTLYTYGDIISVSGNVVNFADNSVSLKIIDSKNIEIWNEKVLIKDDGTFSTLVIAGGDDWVVDGNYVLSATYYDVLAKTFFAFESEYDEIKTVEPLREKVPGWIKNNAEWWAQGEIDDDTFVSGIQYLMKEKIVDIPDLPTQASEKSRPSFVDDTKDPQSYLDRYNNEDSYKEWFDENYPDYTIEEAVGVTVPIPGWIKNTAGWWSEGMITEEEFVKGIEYLVEQRILRVN